MPERKMDLLRATWLKENRKVRKQSPHLALFPLRPSLCAFLLVAPSLFLFVWPLFYFLLLTEQKVISCLFILWGPQNFSSFPLCKDQEVLIKWLLFSNPDLKHFSENSCALFSGHHKWKYVLWPNQESQILQNLWAEVSTPISRTYGFSSPTTLNLDAIN